MRQCLGGQLGLLTMMTRLELELELELMLELVPGLVLVLELAQPLQLAQVACV